jgi:hypothetical protein
MYERGYFRDSYNPSNLLWLFDLSWWRDVLDVLVGKDGKMSPRNAGRFLQMLAGREPVFEANLKKVELAKGETRAEADPGQVRASESLPATGHRQEGER